MNNAHLRDKEATGVQRWLFLLYLLFVVYGSLVPLRPAYRSLDDAIQAFGSIPFLALGIDSRADWVANLLLFIPLTFLASLPCQASKVSGQRVLVALLIASSAVFLAVAIEFIQLFFPQRTVSQNDIFAESVGGLIGLAVHWFYGTRFQNWLRGFWLQEMQQARLVRVLHGYLILLLAFNILPLDLTLSPVELFHKWREGRIVLLPFAGLPGGLSQALYGVGTDILIWVPAGWLWALQPGSSPARVLRHGLVAAAVIEILQLFVYSRVTDITDVCLAGLGATVGWALVWGIGRTPPAVWRLMERHWLPLWLTWAVLTLCLFWFPFNFEAGGLNGPAAIAAFTRLPFLTYYDASEYHAVNELLRKVAFFLPGGLLLGFTGAPLPGSGRRAPTVPLLLLALLALGVEAGQLALPGKVADFTDAMLEFAGGLLGYRLARWIRVPAAPASWAVAAMPPPNLGVDTRRQKFPALAQSWLAGYPTHLASVVGLSMVMGGLLTLPNMPYNLRELLAPGLAGVASLLGLSLTVYGIANGAFLLFSPRRRRWFLAFPAPLLVLGLLAWGLLRVSVPMESLEDIVGTPVLGWPWEWEMLGRFCALHLSLMMPVLGASLCVAAILKPVMLGDFLYWIVVCLALSWPLHLLVVQSAATDNLTELIAGNAGFLSSCALASAWFLTCLTGSALSAALHASRHTVSLARLALVAAVGAALLYWLGTEHTVVKYGRVFSAFQFILSVDRQHYAQGLPLVLRYLSAFAMVCCAFVALQWLSWQWFYRAVLGAHRIRPALSAATPSLDRSMS